MNTICIVQVRMDAQRLPGKVLLPVCGKPLLGHMLERLRRCESLDEIVVATSDGAEDGPIAFYAEFLGFPVYRGSLDDVLGRHFHAAVQHQADIVVRIPGDNPVPEPSEVDRMVNAYESGCWGSNLMQILGNGYPDGIGCEVFSAPMLTEAFRMSTEREHPHKYWFDYQTQQATGNAPIITVDCPSEFARPDVVLDVNTPEEYENIKAIYDALYPDNPQFGIRDILTYLDAKVTA